MNDQGCQLKDAQVVLGNRWAFWCLFEAKAGHAFRR